MKIHNVIQGSDEWLSLRAGIVTASELDHLVSPTGKIRTGETPHTYLCRKLAEKWVGGPLPAVGSWAMEQGQILEPEVLAIIELALDVGLERVGFVTTDDGLFGASPDAMGFEIKSPQHVNHVKYLLAGVCPPEYWLQVQGCMYATGRDSWQFISYRRGMPMLNVKVERDPDLMNTIEDALTKFQKSLDEGWKILVDCNGGELPKQRKPRTVADEPPMIGLETFDLTDSVAPNFRGEL